MPIFLTRGDRWSREAPVPALTFADLLLWTTLAVPIQDGGSQSHPAFPPRVAQPLPESRNPVAQLAASAGMPNHDAALLELVTLALRADAPTAKEAVHAQIGRAHV